MYDFVSSIANVIGEYVNKLIDFCSGKKNEPKTAVPDKIVNKSKPATWVRKKK